MEKRTVAEVAPATLPFEKFWAWLQAHANCIVRAGTADAVLFDHEDYHWHLVGEGDTAAIVQLVRGKELVGELLLQLTDIAYVQYSEREGEEYAFECVVEAASGQETGYHFVMAHEYDEEDLSAPRRWTH